jgi:serine/threonine protein kinase
MTDPAADLEARLGRFVEHHVLEGEHLDVDLLCADRPELAPSLRVLVERYLTLTTSFNIPPSTVAAVAQDFSPAPVIEGFDTIERIGAGGMGEVYKLRDRRLNRIVAAKVVRGAEGGWQSRFDVFLREARALALFSDRRIVQVHEVRLEAEPPVLIMEYVEGFELGRIGRSLEYGQRARIVAEVCEAIHHAHTLGLQHRDLKPSNIMLDAHPRFRPQRRRSLERPLRRHAAVRRTRTTGSFSTDRRPH